MFLNGGTEASFSALLELAFSQILPSRQVTSSISVRVLPAVDVKQCVLKVKQPFFLVFSLGRLSYSQERCTGGFGPVGWLVEISVC